MKKRWLLPLCALSLSLTLTPARAQETEALPESGPVEADPFGETLPLIPEPPAVSQPLDFQPDDLPVSPGVPRSLEPPKPSETRLAIEKQQREVNMRKARIRAEADPDLQAIRQGARQARTDAERRYALNLYYDRLYALMLKIDPSLRQDELEDRKRAAVAPLTQDEIRASVWTPAGAAAR